MALDPLELGVIALMGIAVFIWGPEKVPEIAKQIGSARKEIEVYTKQLQGITKELQSSMTTGNLDNLGNVLTGAGAAAGAGAVVNNASPNATNAPGVAPAVPVLPAAVPVSPSNPAPVTKSADQLLIEMAKQLGVSTAGKTRDDIQSEILLRASQPVEPPDEEGSQSLAPVAASTTVPPQSAA